MNIISLIRNQFFNRKAKKKFDEFSNLKSIPRYTKTEHLLEGKKIIIPDNASFLFMYDEIFKKKIYNFKSQKRTPFIIDGGANIGLSIIYFKKLYPDSKIIAFEPDPEIFKILEGNLEKFNYQNLKLINKGLWNEENELDFWSEGADGGLLSEIDNSNKASTKVATTSLNKFLKQEVDLLKLDIEGAETAVLKDIQSNLNKVKRIFVEYHSFKDKPQSIDEILSILTGAGFRLHINSPGVSSKSPFVKLNIYNNMDMQLNIYGFKEKLN